MNDKEEFFDVPKPGPGRRSPRKRSGRGFLTHFAWMVLLGGLALGVALAVVKFSGNGPALKRAIISWLGGTTGRGDAPAQERPADEPARERIVEIEKVVEVPVEKIVEKIVEVKPPMPSGYVDWKKVDVAKLWSDIPVKTEMVTTQGDTAVKERAREASYGIEMKVTLTVPKPNESAAELAAINAHLPKMLKDFGKIVDAAEVSPFYHHLYSLKTERIQQNVTRIDELLSRHNLYDLETILQVKHPGTGRKLLLAQGEMDVVSDGSDGDRWPELDDYISMSQFYQPFTSYGWPKQTKTPNPLLERWETKLGEYEKEFALPGLSIERNRFLREQIEEYKPRVADLKARSYLIAEADPFIVIPLSLLGRRDENEFGPAIGDYAVVVYNDQLNPKASPYNRPVSDLTIPYLIFPGSADEKKGPPNLEAWHQKCSVLLADIGGLGEGYSLHRWDDFIAKKKAEQEAAKAAAAGNTPAPTTPATTTPAVPVTRDP